MTELWCRTLHYRGHAVAHLVETLRYKAEGCGFDSRFWPCYGPEIYLTSNRNENEEYFLGSKDGRCVGLTTLPPSRADCLEIGEPQTSGTLRASPGLYRNFFTFQYTVQCCTNREMHKFRQSAAFCTVVPNICGSEVQNFVDVSLLASNGEWRKKTVQIAGVRRSGRENQAKTVLYMFLTFSDFCNWILQHRIFYPENGDSSALRNVGTYLPITMFYVCRTVNLKLNLIDLVRALGSRVEIYRWRRQHICLYIPDWRKVDLNAEWLSPRTQELHRVIQHLFPWSELVID